MNITKFIEAARKESEKSRSPEYWVGAVIVSGGQIVGRGHNRLSAKMERWEKRFKIKLWSLHAEMDALLGCDCYIGATIFVSGRKAKNGNKFCCKPCSKCWRILEYAKIRDVYYDTPEGIVYEEIIK